MDKKGNIKTPNKENTVKFKSKKFAVRIYNLAKFLTEEKKEYIFSNQILRSGTSIGANIAESECAVSKKDFTNKIYIAFKECNETKYWLELLFETNNLNKEQFENIMSDCEELRKMLSSITKTLKLDESE